MERTKRKAINFDLDTKEMKNRGLYPAGYTMLGNTLRKHGFEHRQGSGYISKEKLDSVTVARIIEQTTKENLWLKDCVKKIDVTDIGRQHDLTELVKEFGNEEEPQLSEEENLEEEPVDNFPQLTM